MVPELEKPRVTEIQVRMDCNGCVQKIKKALHGINGIYDLYIDLPQQKLTIVGWADPERIVKAIRKARKTATICSHTQPTESDAQPTDQPTEEKEPEGGAPPQETDAANPPPAEAPPAEAAPPPPAEPPKDPPPPENPLPPEEKPSPSPVAEVTNSSQPQPEAPGQKDVGEVHVIYHHHPPDYGYRYAYGHNYGGNWNRYPIGQAFPPDAPKPVYVTHSYNTYRPSPYVTEYVRSPPRYTFYGRMDQYNEDCRETNRNGNGNITSMFSDENPNACRIM